EPVLILAVPAERLDGRQLGVFATKVKLENVKEDLRQLVTGTEIHVYLSTGAGAFILSPDGSSPELMATRLKPATVDQLIQREGRTVLYSSATGVPVVGSLRRVPLGGWAVASEIPAVVAYRE